MPERECTCGSCGYCDAYERAEAAEQRVAELEAALERLYGVVLNDVACPVEYACISCTPVYAQVRAALDGECDTQTVPFGAGTLGEKLGRPPTEGGEDVRF